MEIVTVQNQINERIKRLEELCTQLDEAGQKKADAIANYDVTFAVAMAKLTRGKISQIDGETLPDTMPATCVKEYAKGVCSKEKAELEVATHRYKSLTTKIDTLLATINAKQSIFRHLSHEVR
jgi:hypothetical protein